MTSKAAEALYECTAVPEVRFFLASVAQDAQTEKIDMPGTWKSIQFSPMEDRHKKAMFAMRTALQTICSLMLSDPLTKNSSSQYVFQDKVSVEWQMFLFENHTRITKLLAASRVVEHLNLSSFGVTPQPDDIPTHIVMLAVVVRRFQEHELAPIMKSWRDYLEQWEGNEIIKEPTS